MRWILFCLISFNLLYFGWMQFLAGSPQHVSLNNKVDEVAGDGFGLVLLKEVLPKAGDIAPPPSINASSRFTSKSIVATKASTEVSVERAGLQQSGALIHEDAPLRQKAESLIGVTGMREPEVVVEPVVERVCAQLGPYDDIDIVNGLSLRLVEAGLESAVREESVVVTVDNWVLIPPLGSRKEALKLLRELQGNKIDSYLVTEGEFKNAISLGLFKKPASAQGVLEKMLSAGYTAKVEKIERMKTHFWASVSGDFEAGQARQMLSQLVEDREKIIFSESLCEMFASTP